MDYRPFIAKSIMDVATDRKEGVWCYISHELKKKEDEEKSSLAMSNASTSGGDNGPKKVKSREDSWIKRKPEKLICGNREFAMVLERT
jgi:hypothetical protein